MSGLPGQIAYDAAIPCTDESGWDLCPHCFEGMADEDGTPCPHCNGKGGWASDAVGNTWPSTRREWERHCDEMEASRYDY